MSLCSVLILVHIDYAASAWYAGITNTLKHRLQVCQNKVVRFIWNMSPIQTVNYNVFKSLTLLNIWWQGEITSFKSSFKADLSSYKPPPFLFWY